MTPSQETTTASPPSANAPEPHQELWKQFRQIRNKNKGSNEEWTALEKQIQALAAQLQDARQQPPLPPGSYTSLAAVQRAQFIAAVEAVPVLDFGSAYGSAAEQMKGRILQAIRQAE